MNIIQGTAIQPRQMERSDSGETPVVWSNDSHPYDDPCQVKAELNAKAREGTVIPINPTQYCARWVTIHLKG